MGIPNMSLPELRPVQTENPMDQYAKALQLRQMQGQNQLQGLQTQQQQQALKDQQAGTAAYREWDGKDPQMLFKAMADKGASLSAIQSTQQHFLDNKQKYSTIAKDDSETGKNNLQIMKDKNDNIVGRLKAVSALGDADLVPGLQSAAQDLVQQGLLDPQHGQMAMQLAQSGDPGKIRNALSLFEKGYMSDSQQLDQATKEAQAFKDTQQGNEAAAKVASGAVLSPEQRSMNDWLAKNPGKGPADYEQAKETKTSTQSDSLGVTSSTTSRPSLTTGGRGPVSSLPAPSLLPPGSGKMTPDQIRNNIVDMVGQYRYNPSQLARLQVKHPEIIAAINQKYPDWDQTNYNAKNQIVQKYTSGPESTSINAISTALGHASELGDAIDALHNGDAGLKTLRGIGNRLGVETGGDAVTIFNTIVHRLGPEITSAYIKGGGGEGERISNAEDFSPSLADKQLRGNLGITVKLLRSKIEAQEQQWNNTYKPTRPEDAFATRFLTPRAQTALQKYSPQGGQQGGVVVTDPRGMAHSFPNQQAADQFKKAAGIQ